jgi:hypothetical protein
VVAEVVVKVQVLQEALAVVVAAVDLAVEEQQELSILVVVAVPVDVLPELEVQADQEL